MKGHVRVLKYLYFIMKAMGILWRVWKMHWEWGKMVVGKVVVLIQGGGGDDSDLTKIVAMEMEQSWLITDTSIHSLKRWLGANSLYGNEAKKNMERMKLMQREAEETVMGCVRQIYKGAKPKNM